MRTLYTLFALISLVLVALVATAAPANPTLNLSCGTSICAAGQPFHFYGDGLNPHKSYEIDGVGWDLTDPTNPILVDSLSHAVTVNSDGTYNDQDSFLPAANWTFTLSVLDHSGNPQKDLVVETVVFQ